MKATTGLLALGLLTLAGVVTVSCGGSSDDGDNENTAGSSSAGKGTGGGSSGSSSTAGKTSSGGSGNSSGSGNGGTNANNGGRNNQGGTFPGAGGAPNVDECDDGVANGMTCVPAQGAANACQLDDTTYCTCAGNDPKWICTDLGDLGAGGNGGFGDDVTCPANAKNGDACTGIGVCPGSTTCGCVLGTIYCGGPQQ